MKHPERRDGINWRSDKQVRSAAGAEPRLPDTGLTRH